MNGPDAQADTATGSSAQNATTPARAELPVLSSTYQGTPSRVSESPVTEITFAASTVANRRFPVGNGALPVDSGPRHPVMAGCDRAPYLPAERAEGSGHIEVRVVDQKTAGGGVVDERIVGQPLDGPALGADVTERVPR
jgi:hypothetical protein